MNYGLMDNFRKIGELIRKNGRRGRKGNVPVAQNRILKILQNSDGLSQKELAYMLAIRPQSAGELINKMQSAGLLQKQSDQFDSRINKVYLTEQGRADAQQIDVESPRRSIFSCLTEEETEILNQLLEKVINSNDNGHDEEQFEPRFPERFGEPRMHGFERNQENCRRERQEPSRRERRRPRPHMGVFRGPQEPLRRGPHRHSAHGNNDVENRSERQETGARRMPYDFGERRRSQRDARRQPFVDDNRDERENRPFSGKRFF